MHRRFTAVLIGLALVATACAGSPDTFDDFETPGDWVCYILGGVVVVEDGADVGTALGSNATATQLDILDLLRDTSDDPNPPEDGFEAAGGTAENLLDAYEVSEDPIQVARWLTSQGVPASPVHAAGLSSHWRFRPGTDPEPIEGVTLRDLGDAVQSGSGESFRDIAVVDSGFAPGSLPGWLAGNVVFDPSDEEFVGDGDASHGTFVASVLRQMAPEHRISMARPRVVNTSEIVVVGSEPPSPVPPTTELHVAEAIFRLMDRSERDPLSSFEALNLSLGAYSCDPGSDPVMLTTTTAIDEWLSTHRSAPVVAAAGNEVYDAPFWPASHSGVEGIAATNLDGDEVVWDNNNEKIPPNRSWVDFAVPGVNIVGHRGGDESLIAWSGSSFATAVATAQLVNGITSLSPDHESTDRLTFSPNPGNSEVIYVDPQSGPTDLTQ